MGYPVYALIIAGALPIVFIVIASFVLQRVKR